MKLSDEILNPNAQIKNIIFDWGGVITDLDFTASDKAFRKYGLNNFIEQYNINVQRDYYTKLETGNITPDEFRNQLRKFIPGQVSDNEIDQAWAALLCELPEERWNLLKEVKKSYNSYLLSNTNKIHVDCYFQRIYEKYGTYGYRHLFKKTYFSYELGMRKPDMEIFEFVIKDSNLKPGETLLIDDYYDNILTAGKLGIVTYHLKKPVTIIDIFNNE